MNRKPPPTADALRIWIDRGAAGDKIAFPDPAAAPLETDAEAAGSPPSEAERSLAARQCAFQPTVRGGRPYEGSVLRWRRALPASLVFLAAGVFLSWLQLH